MNLWPHNTVQGVLPVFFGNDAAMVQHSTLSWQHNHAPNHVNLLYPQNCSKAFPGGVPSSEPTALYPSDFNPLAAAPSRSMPSSSLQNATVKPPLWVRVGLTAEQEATLLRRAKNLKIESAKDSRRLTQEIVQDVILHIANGKAKNVQRFIRGETTTEEQRSAKPCSERATQPTVATVPPSSDGGAVAAAAPVDTCDSSKPWSKLGRRERCRRAHLALQPFRTVFWPAYVKQLAAVDDDGNTLGNNELLKIMLDHGINKAMNQNRLAPGVRFPECLPDSTLRIMRDKWLAERVDEEYCEYRQEQLEEWFQFYHKVGNEAWNMLRKLLPDWMMPSLYQIQNYRKELELHYAHRMA
jgi:hypothetical protein